MSNRLLLPSKIKKYHLSNINDFKYREAFLSLYCKRSGAHFACSFYLFVLKCPFFSLINFPGRDFRSVMERIKASGCVCVCCFE